jgi:hypothetical protein
MYVCRQSVVVHVVDILHIFQENEHREHQRLYDTHIFNIYFVLQFSTRYCRQDKGQRTQDTNTIFIGSNLKPSLSTHKFNYSNFNNQKITKMKLRVAASLPILSLVITSSVAKENNLRKHKEAKDTDISAALGVDEHQYAFSNFRVPSEGMVDCFDM